MLVPRARAYAVTEQPRVTVVNDNAEFLALVGEILTSDHFVTTLIDGDRGDALQHIRESKPDVLMIDLRLGTEGLHGWDIAQAARRDPELKELPILVCSADHKAMEGLGEQVATDTQVALLRKPFAVDELTQAIERLLDRGVPA